MIKLHYFKNFKHLIVFIITALIFAACTNEKANKKNETKRDNVLAADPSALDSIASPNVIKINKDSLTIITPGENGVPLPQVILAGKPTVVTTNTNIHPAGKPEVILAGTPRIITPGQDTFPLPQTIKINFDYLKTTVAGIPEVVIAKDPYTRKQNPDNFSSFGKLQGLKHDVIKCMLQDHHGNLWFGTWGGGVSKYDGNCEAITNTNKNKQSESKYFTNFTENEGLSNNLVSSILQDHSRNIWFGTAGGVSKL